MYIAIFYYLVAILVYEGLRLSVPIGACIEFVMDNSSRKSRFYLLIVLFLISHYVGSWGADASLVDGKNAITFSFIYVLGMMLREYKSKTELISTKLLATVYVGWNIVIVAVFSHPEMVPCHDFFYNRVFFSYCSIGLLINAVMLFLLLIRLNFKSKIVNVLGGGVFNYVYGPCGEHNFIWIYRTDNE